MSPTACIRGCHTARQHLPGCPDRDECSGCLPREAVRGRLCYPCHARLRSHLQAVHGQWALLLVTSGRSLAQDFTMETTARPSHQPRLSSDAKFPGPWASMQATAVSESEPVRLAALDAAQALSDWLCETVECVAGVHNATGPARLLPGDRDPRRWKWHPVDPDTGRPMSRYDPVVVHSDGRETMRGQYVLTDPPPRFEVRTAADWLLAWLDRLEALDLVGDALEELAELMSRAHALAPWREQVARLPGIPCPECHRRTLVRFGGDEDVTCLECRTMIPPGRYLIWTRMLVQEHKGQRDPDDRAGGAGAGRHPGRGAEDGAAG